MFRPDTAVHLDLVTAPARTLVGPQAFGEFVSTSIERFDHFTFVILNTVVDLDGDDRATGRIFMCEIRHDREADTWPIAHGVYNDVYARADGQWWFAERRYRSMARMGPDGAVFGLPDG